MENFINAFPSAVSQGLIWGIMAIGVYITFRILDVSDLTVDGSFCTGGVTFVNSVASTVCVVLLYLALRPALEHAKLLTKGEKK